MNYEMLLLIPFFVGAIFLIKMIWQEHVSMCSYAEEVEHPLQFLILEKDGLLYVVPKSKGNKS